MIFQLNSGCIQFIFCSVLRCQKFSPFPLTPMVDSSSVVNLNQGMTFPQGPSSHVWRHSGCYSLGRDWGAAQHPTIPHNKTVSTPAVSSATAENPPPASARRTLDQGPHGLLQLTPDSRNILDTLHGHRRLRLSTGTHSCHSTTSTAFPHLMMQDKPTVVPPKMLSASLQHVQT